MENLPDGLAARLAMQQIERFAAHGEAMIRARVG
jgi:hypothetical protein